MTAIEDVPHSWSATLADAIAESADARRCAEDTVVRAMLPAAQAIARRYRDRGVETEELESAAALALVQAVRGFDPERGRLEPYVVVCVRGAVKKHFRDHGWTVRPPRRLQELSGIARRAREEHAQAGSAPTRLQLARELHVEESELAAADSTADCFSPVSLDADRRDGSGPRGDLVAVPDDVDAAVDHVLLLSMCEQLSSQERDLLRLRFYDDLTQQEIAEQIGVTQMSVSRRLRKVLDKMRAAGRLDADAA